MPSAYLLVSHGSRDPRPEIAMQQLAELVFDKAMTGESLAVVGSVAAPPRCETLVGTGYLELREPLHTQIQAFARQAAAAGYKELKILPLFLLPGVHVKQDIPAEVAAAQQVLGGSIHIDVQPYLGTHLGLKALLGKPISKIKADGWILISHGSRRPGSLIAVEEMAASLGAVAAYWAVSPSLTVRVQELVNRGCKQIGILPYFLFAGGITDAIALSLESLKLQFPTVSFHLAEPLGASADLAELIWDLVK